MRIYTKGGDKGQTSLFSGKRVRKDDPLVNAYGTVDELNSSLGLARALHGRDDRLGAILAALQPQLFELGAMLAAGKPGLPPRISEKDIQQHEAWIDELQAGLEPLTTFIMPTGHPAAGALHVARTVCRRAERLVVSLTDTGMFDPLAVRYLNRLADLLFVLAREANRAHGQPDSKWSPRPAGAPDES